MRQTAKIKTELIEAERDFIYQLLRDGKITDEARRRIEYELDLEEAGVANRGERWRRLDVVFSYPSPLAGEGGREHLRAAGGGVFQEPHPGSRSLSSGGASRRPSPFRGDEKRASVIVPILLRRGTRLLSLFSVSPRGMERREGARGLVRPSWRVWCAPAARLARRASPLAKGPAPPGRSIHGTRCRRAAPCSSSGVTRDDALCEQGET